MGVKSLNSHDKCRLATAEKCPEGLNVLLPPQKNKINFKKRKKAQKAVDCTVINLIQLCTEGAKLGLHLKLRLVFAKYFFTLFVQFYQ